MQSNLTNKLIELRRVIHANPELGYREFNTAKLVCAELDFLDIPYQNGIAGTGVVATIRKGEGKRIALRADMDALPIQEETGLSYASNNSGVMHACGHDVHMTMLIGAANILKEKDFNGEVRLIFQPSEEGSNGDPECKSGGQRMVELGYLDDCDHAVGLHVHPLLEVGKISFALGNALACADEFTIIVNGKSGHAGAAPHLAIDALIAATALVQNAQSIVSRTISPTDTGVVSFTMINGGTATNIIADKVTIKGTIRALQLETYQHIVQRLKLVIKGIEAAYGVTTELKFSLFYPSLVNDAAVHQKLAPVANKVFNGQVVEIEPFLGGEDFAFYSRKTPSMFYFLGAHVPGSGDYFVHHPKVQINEDCISFGSTFLAEAAVELMS